MNGRHFKLQSQFFFFHLNVSGNVANFVIVIDRFSCDGGGNPNKTFGKALVTGFYKYQFHPVFIYFFYKYILKKKKKKIPTADAPIYYAQRGYL